ncbi:MAG: hypothetical protein WA913_03110 [Pricia sp.]
MKKVIRTAAMVALMFATATGMANDTKLNVDTAKNVKSLVFEMDDNSGVTKIKLVDADNHVIYSESIANASYAKKFDLKALNNGLYYFTSENSLKTVVYTVKVAGDDVTIIEKRENAKPVFRKKSGMVYLNLLNLGLKDVEISVYDSSNRLVFSEKRENEMIIEKSFNFKKAYKDSYTVVVKDDNDTYYENIVIN